jgi:hypothetical protein
MRGIRDEDDGNQLQAVLEQAGIGFSFALDGDGVKKACGITYSEPERSAAN